MWDVISHTAKFRCGNQRMESIKSSETVHMSMDNFEIASFEKSEFFETSLRKKN